MICSALATLALAPAGTVQAPSAGLPDMIFGLSDTGTRVSFSSASPVVVPLSWTYLPLARN